MKGDRDEVQHLSRRSTTPNFGRKLALRNVGHKSTLTALLYVHNACTAEKVEYCVLTGELQSSYLGVEHALGCVPGPPAPRLAPENARNRLPYTAS